MERFSFSVIISLRKDASISNQNSWSKLHQAGQNKILHPFGAASLIGDRGFLTSLNK
jgi:hypothetical protein